jgi:hypothetical protein
MRHYTLLSTLVVAALASAQASPAPSPAAPSPPAALAGSAAPPAPVGPAISIKEGTPVSPDAPRVFNIMVGGANSKLQFQPESVSAKPGDTIKFMFMDGDNSVMQTTFEAPCQAKQGGFTAGPMPNPNGAMPGPTQELKIASPDPLCRFQMLLENG